MCEGVCVSETRNSLLVLSATSREAVCIKQAFHHPHKVLCSPHRSRESEGWKNFMLDTPVEQRSYLYISAKLMN